VHGTTTDARRQRKRRSPADGRKKESPADGRKKGSPVDGRKKETKKTKPSSRVEHVEFINVQPQSPHLPLPSPVKTTTTERKETTLSNRNVNDDVTPTKKRTKRTSSLLHGSTDKKKDKTRCITSYIDLFQELTT